MAWTRQRKKWPWRDFLTVEEAAKVEQLEGDISIWKEEVHAWTAELSPIRNRAIQRAKYQARKEAENG